MNILAASTGVLVLTTGLASWGALHEYGRVQASRAECTALRQQDAKDTADALLRAQTDAAARQKAEDAARIEQAQNAIEAAQKGRESTQVALDAARRELRHAYILSPKVGAWANTPLPDAIRDHVAQRLRLVSPDQPASPGAGRAHKIPPHPIGPNGTMPRPGSARNNQWGSGG